MDSAAPRCPPRWRAGAILQYLKELRRSVDARDRLTVYRNSQFMIVDAATQANLELDRSRGGGRDTSLLGCARSHAHADGRAETARLDSASALRSCGLCASGRSLIGDLLAEPFLLGNLRETLKGIRDLERTVGRLTQTGGNARDLRCCAPARTNPAAPRRPRSAAPEKRGDSSLMQFPSAMAAAEADWRTGARGFRCTTIQSERPLSLAC